MRLIGAIFVLVGAAMAQDCPAEPVLVGPYIQAKCGAYECTKVDVVNHAEKEIVGIKVSMQFLDSVGDPQSPFHDYTSAVKIKPSKKHEYVWNTKFDAGDFRGGYVAWVEKIMFADGTTWQDDGSKKCTTTHTLRH